MIIINEGDTHYNTSTDEMWVYKKDHWHYLGVVKCSSCMTNDKTDYDLCSDKCIRVIVNRYRAPSEEVDIDERHNCQWYSACRDDNARCS